VTERRPAPLRWLWRAVRARPHLGLGVVAGVAALVLLPATVAPLTATILSWDFGCLVFLLVSAVAFSREHGGRMAADAERQQEGEWTIFWLTVGAVAASFAVIIEEFSAIKHVHGGPPALRVALLVVTLLLSWLMTHTAFALRYAHEYYAVSGRDGEVDGGLEFPGEKTPDYWDFLYFALVLGMTFQVSDVQITARKLRRLATVHGLLAFLFNTVILALSVNIGASFL
jgi:uncharacterized membrane protein